MFASRHQDAATGPSPSRRRAARDHHGDDAHADPAASAGTAPHASPPCPPPAPLDQLDPGRAFGCPFAPTTLTVTDVSADEGFWATTANQQVVWIHLVGPGESPVQIVPGQQLSVAGQISAARSQPGQMGLPAAGDPRAAGLQYYLEVAYTDVSLAG